MYNLVPRLGLPRKTRRRPLRTARAKLSLTATGLSLPVVVLVLWFAVETARPDCLDPTYVKTRLALSAARAGGPDHRLAVAIGSSRLQLGFAPEAVSPQVDSTGRPVRWFNASHYEAGPGMNHVTLSRLLRDGHTPALVVMELLPAFCARGAAGLLSKHTTYRDAPAAIAADLPADLLATAVLRRVRRLRDLGPAWTGSDPGPLPIGPFGNSPAPPAVPSTERARRTATQLSWLNYLLKLPSIHPATDRATRATVAACRDRGIALAFVITPESTDFRAAYDPAGLARFDDWVAKTSGEYGVKIIDARGWIPDEQFVDGHHPTADGAAAFTARLVRELGPVR